MSNQFMQVRGIVKKYGQFLALDQFSCEIPSGVTGLLGPNGAGKTTFIRCLLGIHPYESGVIDFLDWELPRDLIKVKDNIGYQPEVDTTLNKTSAMKYVTHMCRLAGLPREASIQRAFDTLHYVGLEEARYREMTTFSQGMLQKVKLATALVHDPFLLILDEPTAGCDPDSREQILKLIRELGKDYGKNILISSHLLPDIEFCADNVVVMSEGKTIMQGGLKSILQQQDKQVQLKIMVSGDYELFANILSKNGFNVTEVAEEISCLIDNNKTNVEFLEIFKLAKEFGMNVRMLSPYRQRLEDVFLAAIREEDAVEEVE
jgi:ABC-2 type transport system ATP-binding protein